MPMTTEEAFWLIHDGLARQAPGSDETTRYLLVLKNGSGYVSQSVAPFLVVS